MYQLFTPPWISTSRIGLPGRGRGAVAEDLAHPQHGPGRVPVLAQSDLRPLDALAAKFPVGVQPVGVADHDHQAVFGVPILVGDGSKRQGLWPPQAWL